MAKISKKRQALNREKWIEALESGKYRQTKGSLHTKKKKHEYFCCLGVACVLAMEDGVKMKVTNYFEKVIYDDNRGYLPEKVRNWLGLNCTYGRYDDGNNSLVNLNDEGKSFKTIAKVIREKMNELVE